jgi:hypothetical protein
MTGADCLRRLRLLGLSREQRGEQDKSQGDDQGTHQAPPSEALS